MTPSNMYTDDIKSILHLVREKQNALESLIQALECTLKKHTAAEPHGENDS